MFSFVDVHVRNLTPWISPVPPRARQLPGHLCRVAVKGARPSASPSLKASARTMRMEVTRVTLHASCWKRSDLVDARPAPSGETSERLLDLLVKMEKGSKRRLSFAGYRCQRQDELRQAEVRAEGKTKELRELHKEILKVREEMDLFIPQPVPPRLLLLRPLLTLWEVMRMMTIWT